MKTLVNEISGRKDFPNFNGTNQQIADWVESNLSEFDLNEEFSCNVFFDGKKEIEIRGDEDLYIFRIIEIAVITL